MKPGSYSGSGFLFVFMLAALLSGCSSNSLRYTAEELVAFDKMPSAVELEFQTSKGKQTAFYVGAKAPKQLVVMFPGIGSRALDRLDWVKSTPLLEAGWLLIDYPGRGNCEGSMRPKFLPQTSAGALGVLATHITIPKSLTVVGHSFGTAAALQFCQDHPVDCVVLLAPFTTLKKAMFQRIGPLAWIVPDNLDSRAMLRRLLEQRPSIRITIVHGSADKSIPIEMGRELYAIAPGQIEFVEAAKGSHTSILKTEQDLIFKRIFAIPDRPEGTGNER